ncbi:hypothetical protein C8Q80DRAFT_216065 [Daedaleopsis nitida]|nr:hypothetical protein C8Q80DRAFT_216065 [Daedaleopsis nitida]
MIFRYIVGEPLKKARPGELLQISCRPLLSITHVCHAWRRICLSDPTLWAYFIVTWHPRLIEEFLRRSQSAPLSVVMTEQPRDRIHNVYHVLYPEDQSPDFYPIGWSVLVDEVLKRYSRRIRRLQLNFGRREPGDIFPGCLEHPAPTIEVLTVSGPLCEDVHRPPLLFGQKISSLQGLGIMDTASWLPTNDFPRLTHLYLSLPKNVRRETLLQESMLLLSTAPSLQYLYFEQDSWSPATYTGPKITLLSLRHLSITSRFTPLPFYLFEYLDLHDEVLVRFVGSELRLLDGNQENDLWDVPIRPFRAITAITQVELCVNYHTLSLLARDAGKQGALSIWTVHAMDGPPTHTPEPSVGLLAMLSPSSVTHLRVAVVYADMLSTIVALLPRLS